jgi:hypothetical protein
MQALLITLLMFGASTRAGGDVGPTVRALWFIQQHGMAKAVNPANDEHVKAVVFKALDKDGVLALSELDGLMEAAAFKTIAGADDRIDADEMRKAVESGIPESRSLLLPKVRAHADFLTTTFDMIGADHRQAGQTLADWIASNYRPGQPLNVVVVCTGNTRRSILAATTGNIAASYYGMPEVRFYCGGTSPTALNARALKTLREMGVEIDPLGKEAGRGEPNTANPMYRVRWGSPSDSRGPAMEAVEFSKHYTDSSNPQQGFAGLTVCAEADVECPVVKGSALRISMHYLDPKIYDDGAYESAKYAERRDDMGRSMLSVMLQAQKRCAHRNP